MTLVAVGDSNIHAEDSWAAWLARAMGEDLRRVSANGSRSDDALEQVSTLTAERYAVACLSIGGNDALFDWNAEVYAERLVRILDALRAVADQVLAATVTRSFAGFPGAGPGVRRRVEELNALITASGVTVVAGDDLRGPRLLQADRVHYTLEGQLLLADRAAAALGVTPPPSTLADPGQVAVRWAFHRVAARQAPRQAVKRALRRPIYEDPRDDRQSPAGD